MSKNILNLPYLLLAFTLLTIPFFTGLNIGDLHLILRPSILKTNWALIMAPLIILAMFFSALKNNEKIILKAPNFSIYLLLFYVISLLSYFWSINKYDAMQFLEMYSMFMIFYMLSYNLITTRKKTLLVFRIFTFTSMVAALIGLSQYYLGGIFPIFEGLFTQLNPPGSTFGNRNFLGHYILLTLPISLVLLFLSKRTTSIFYYFFTSILSILTLSVIDAKQLDVAMLMLLIVLIVFLIFDYFYNKKQSFFNSILPKNKIAFITIIGVICIYLSQSFIPISSLSSLSIEKFIPKEISEKISTEHRKGYAKKNDPDKENMDGNAISYIEKSNSYNTRVNTWLNTLEMIKDNLFFGVGIGQWKSNYIFYHDRVAKDFMFSDTKTADSPHNLFIQIFADHGLVGFLLLLVFFIKLAISSWPTIKVPDSPGRDITLIVLLSTVSFLVISVFSKPLSSFMPTFLIMVLAGILSRNLKLPESHFILSKKLTLSSLFAGLTFSLGLAYYAYKSTLGEFWGLAAIYAPGLNHNLDKAILYSSNSLEYVPDNPQVLANAGTFALVNKNLELSKEFYTKALKLNPVDVASMWNLSEIYRAKSQVKEQQEILERGLLVHPTNFKFLFAYTQVLFSQGDKRSSETYNRLKDSYEKYRFRDGYQILYNKLIKFVLSVGDYKFLKVLYQDLIKIRPTANTYAVYGIILFNKFNDIQNSKKMLEKAIQTDPSIEIPLDIRNALEL